MCLLISSIGCASPGPPQPPSLHLPAPVTDLTASRVGGTVELRFTAPTRSTDKLRLRAASISGQFCRQLSQGPCTPVASSKTSVAVPGLNHHASTIEWVDTLPADLVQGPPRPLAYRVEFFNAGGRSAGPSAPAFTAAGEPPLPVEDLRVQGSRIGVVLTWKPAPGPAQVLIKREDLAPAQGSAKRPQAQGNSPLHSSGSRKVPEVQGTGSAAPDVWLTAHQPSPESAQMLDTSALPNHPYRYSAQRRRIVVLNGRSIDLRSQLTPPVDFTLRQIYPPPAPSGLTAAGYFSGSTPAGGIPPSFAVDLIWQPIDDSGPITPLAGYNVYRQRLQPVAGPGQGLEQPVRLNTAAIPIPAFHDASAVPTATYRYSVTAVDVKGNESQPATVLLKPSTTP